MSGVGDSPGVPVVPWTHDHDLIAWRVWGLGYCSGEPWPHLHSLGVPWLWSGPVLRADFLPYGSAQNRSGVHALKPALYGRVRRTWSEYARVVGWVALSGRVVEHELGYRAERAVIRKLRFGLGMHLVEQRLPALRRIASELEDHYQAPVKLGWTERRLAQRLLQQGFTPKLANINWCQPAHGWRVG